MAEGPAAPLGEAGLGREEPAIVPDFTRDPNGFTNATVGAGAWLFRPVPGKAPAPAGQAQGQAGPRGCRGAFC